MDVSRENAYHPYHPHILVPHDPGTSDHHFPYEWTCMACEKRFNVRGNDLTNNKKYRCHKCDFDMCSDCYRGYLHPFHEHRLKPASSQMCYPHTKGLWRCDVCQNIYSPLNTSCKVKMYHCQKCQLDLCTSCFEGKWCHVSHSNRTHSLKPIDPRIHYREYENWICDVCGQDGEHGEKFQPYLHCYQCEEDICMDCFRGTQHHLHQHNLVPATNDGVAKETSQGDINSCSECGKKLLNNSHHLCKFPHCPYYLCRDCLDTPPRPHPLHPQHVLYISDPLLVYPETSGQWQCDCCGRSRSPNDTVSEQMYHCKECSFDLCGSCHNRDIYGTRKTTQPTSPPKPVSPKRTYVSGRDEYHHLHRPPVISSSLRYIPSQPLVTPAPVAPSNKTPQLCKRCGLHVARVTAVHRGAAHSAPSYCQSCGMRVLEKKEPCIVCGLVADEIKEIIW